VTGIVTSQRILLTRFRAPASGSQSLDFQIYGLKEKQNTLECIWIKSAYTNSCITCCTETKDKIPFTHSKSLSSFLLLFYDAV
jgi:hypothetical protein